MNVEQKEKEMIMDFIKGNVSEQQLRDKMKEVSQKKPTIKRHSC